ncbi:hypothetical protein ABPG74_010450 [Tetrahymena malaccensis]
MGDVSKEKYKQLEDLLDKSEKRAERLKTLNDQIKKQLDFEKEKNDEIHQEVNSLRQQLFRAQKEAKEARELLESEVKKNEKLILEISSKPEIILCSKCQQPLIQGMQSSNKNYITPTLSSNMIQSLYIQNGNNTALAMKCEKSLQRKSSSSQLSASSQSSQVSDEESPPQHFERNRKRTMTISVRYNNDKGADHIRAISKSIVARNYESEYQDGINNSQVQSPFKDQKSQGLKLFGKDVKQVSSSHSGFDENQNEEEKQKGLEQSEIKEADAQQENTFSANNSMNNSLQDLPQITFNKKSSSNKTSQFKQQVHIKFQRRMSKTHSTIRSTIEQIEDIDSCGAVGGSQNQSIKSIILTNKKSSSNNDVDDIVNKLKTPSINKEEGLKKEFQFETPQSANSETNTNYNNNKSSENNINMIINQNQSTLNQIPEEGLSLSTSNPNVSQSNTRLFEKFFILGCDKDDMKEFDQDSSTIQGLLPGKILYSYPQLNPDDSTDQVLKIIHEFAFPKGIKSRKIKISTSFRKVTQFILSNSKTMIQNKFYMFTMKSSTHYDIINYKDQSVLNQINPHRLLYCYCFKNRDYLETTYDESNFQVENHKNRSFWETKRVYCFVTLYPFQELFQEMLINVLNQIKISRTSSFSEFESSDPKIIYKLDGDCVQQIIKDKMQDVFLSYRDIQVTDFQQIIIIDTLAGPYKYVIGSQKIIQIHTHKWSLALSLSNLSLQNLMFIFHAILLENTIIFNSRNKCLLTQTIHTFEQLIYPFSWPYPIIYLLPETLQTLFDSPVPIIMGVNNTTHHLQKEDVYSRYPDHIFFDLDCHKIYCNNKQLVKKINTEQPNLNNIYNKIEKVYQQINPQGLVQKKPSIFSDPSRKESEKHKEEYQLKYFCTKQDDQISEIILNIFNESLRQCFVDILPQKIENMINHETNQIDYQNFSQNLIQKSYPQDRTFIKSFINTQIFTYFIENYYQFE